MDTLLNDIKEKSFKRVYLITGDDPWLRHGYFTRLMEAVSGDDTMNRLAVSGSGFSLSDLRAFTDTMPFFAERRVLVIEESGLFRARKKAGAEGNDESSGDPSEGASSDDAAESVQTGPQSIENWLKTLPDTAVVIFTENAADGRNSLYKLISKIGSVTVVNRPEKPEELRRFALGQIGRSGLKITSGAFDKLLERLPLDYGMAASEIEKLLSRCLQKGSIYPEDVEEMITPRLEDRIFDLVEKVSSGSRDAALSLYYDLVALRTPPLLILTLIGREFVRLQNVRDMYAEGLSDREIMNAMSFSKEWLAEKYRRMAGRFRKEELSGAVRLASELELSVKSGNLGEAAASEILILSLTGRG